VSASSANTDEIEVDARFFGRRIKRLFVQLRCIPVPHPFDGVREKLRLRGTDAVAGTATEQIKSVRNHAMMSAADRSVRHQRSPTMTLFLRRDPGRMMVAHDNRHLFLHNLNGTVYVLRLPDPSR